MKFAFLALVFSLSLAHAVPPPAPYGAVPDAAQLSTQAMETYAFVHFTTNTFTDKEWGYGDESPQVFNPTDFDPDQIVGTLAKAGFKGVILTCKHHDGFCMWPTQTTDHNISKSPWKNGKGDMVMEFSAAAKRAGIKFGFYLSPWDRNNAAYGTPEYIKLYRAQLNELLTNYGPAFEVWFDGANGGDGYYGGKNEKRSIDRATYYDWPTTWAHVRKLQPEATLFSDVGPGMRWIGNENGIANYPCWATFTPMTQAGVPAAPGSKVKDLNTGTVDGKFWIPGECDVSIRPGWFWHESENSKVRTPRNLLDLYFKSVGHGATFLLNVPPDRRGRLHEVDVASLEGYKRALDSLFSNNLAKGGKVTADTIRGPEYSAEKLLDDNRETYWATPDSITTASVEIILPEARTFSVIRLREAISLGQRVRKFAVDIRENGQWREWIGYGSSIGAQVLLRESPVTADGVRLRILESAACPCLSEFSLWLEPTNVPDTLAANESASHPLPKTDWKIIPSIEIAAHPAKFAIDGDPATFWSTPDAVTGAPPTLTLDLGKLRPLAAITFLSRQDGTPNGVVDRYRIEWSAIDTFSGKPIEGEFSNIRANPIEQRIDLPHGTIARYIRLTALHALEKNNVTMAEIGVIAP
ncbi:MAG: alpha-L-fucosidase [Gloeobacteraceae cyanobacterium ES-bin-144]|nr:alpha-L-fucosidase [Verrucomicrobiales bacterium]